MVTNLAIWPVAILLAGVVPPEHEPIVESREMISRMPGEACVESVDVCVPYWREILSKRGSTGVWMEIEHPQGEEPFVFVSSLSPGSSGERAGLRMGDRVLAVNGVFMSPDSDGNISWPGCV